MPIAFSVTTRESCSIKLFLLNLYWSAGEPLLVSERTSTGHLYLPVLVEVVTSTAPRSDQYYFVFYMYRALE